MTIIPFDMGHVFEPESSKLENALALRRLLDCLTGVNEDYLSRHTVPPLYQSGVRYRRFEAWLPIPALYERGYGDCKSLACALVAQYRQAGIPCETVFRWRINDAPAGHSWTLFHILVQTAGGFEDPSKVLGMGANENAQYSAQVGRWYR
jgi:Transglutaminase-like superfamily